MASGDDVDQMAAAVEAASASADVVVVTIHWGVEGVAEPDAEDRARAEAMIAAGADVIFGHHPHRLGELEFVDGVPVFWTLGNFVWPRLSDAGATTAVVGSSSPRWRRGGVSHPCFHRNLRPSRTPGRADMRRRAMTHREPASPGQGGVGVVLLAMVAAMVGAALFVTRGNGNDLPAPLAATTIAC
jgi:hypothetical protein